MRLFFWRKKDKKTKIEKPPKTVKSSKEARFPKGVKAATDAVSDKSIIADFIVEEYRFLKSYLSLVNKLFIEERQKYVSTYNFHVGKINEVAEKANVGIVNLEGKEYDDGLSITPLNMDEFTKEDDLIIAQTIEPTIVDTTNGNVLRSGSVMLARNPKPKKKPESPPKEEMQAEQPVDSVVQNENQAEGETK